MTSLLPRSRALLPNIAEWFDGPWPFGEHNLVRIEEDMADGRYVVRAELPGCDPKEHIHVTADHGLLTIAAERSHEEKDKGHTEFRYGSFKRTVSLPAGADTENITASYNDGILEVIVPVQETKEDKPVQIEVGKK